MAVNYSGEYISWLPGQEWEVDEILGYDILKNKFLVKWKGWNEKYNTYEPRENVEGWEGFYNFECERAIKLGLPKPPRGVRGGINAIQKKEEKKVINSFFFI